MVIQNGQGLNRETRGTQNTRVPTQAIAPTQPTAPTGGQPLSGNKGPMKQVGDNVTNAMKRDTQNTFNSGPNASNAMTGLSNKMPAYKTPYDALPVEADHVDKMPSLGSITPAGNVIAGHVTHKASFSDASCDDYGIGAGIKPKDMFGEPTKSKPVETTECETADKSMKKYK